MTVGSALRELGRFLDEFEQTGAVRSVGLVDSADADARGRVTADVELTVATRATGRADATESTERGDTTEPAEGDAAPLSLAAPTVGDDGTLRLTFESTDALVPAAEGVTVEPATVTGGADGTLTVVLSVSVRTDANSATDVDEADGAVEARDPAASLGDDTEAGDESEDRPGEEGRNAREPNKGSVAPENGTADTSATEHDREVPPFRDPDLLAEVYDSCGTFAEMAEELGMDVTGETVRRYMIDAGVHQPNTYDTGTAGDEDANESTTGSDEGAEPGPGVEDDRETEPESETEPKPESDPATGSVEGGGRRVTGGDEAADASESPVVLADGIGLPNDVTVETLVETVKRSNTIYEIEREIGVDREDALDVLRELNLLDLVVGRLATEEERDDISREAVIERLREASATATR
ncbi:hypothetical protein [Salinigranum sp. GCM10025319]|uniref:hypothetical protein n=1 Tax=Salinigranum sp. GCM10025319 TaxID=3252687 RepID=UPI003606B753